MKKKIFSFVIMVVTLITLIVIGSPNIKNTAKTGMEFNGGFDILYEIKSEDEGLEKKELAKTAAEGIKKRLDISNIIDPIVSTEGNNYVRVTVSASNQIIADEIREVIENNAEISFRDYQNNLLATGEEILEEVGAELSSETDSYGNPIILLKIKDTELLGEITETVSGLDDTHLVVWLGFEEGDDYANLSTDASVAKKIIYNATVSSRLEEETITVTGSFTKSQAQSTIDLINSGTVDYSLNVVQISTIDTDSASIAFDKVLIAGLIVIVLITIALSIYYKLGGLLSSLSLVFSVFLSLTLFVSFKGIINQQVIAALIVSIGIMVDAIIILLERVKNELYNGKNVERALNEGYKKSLTSIIDANVVIFIMSLVMYFLGNSVENFALMISLSCVSNLLSMIIINKLLLSLLIRLNLKATSLGAKKAYLENKNLYLENKINKVNPLKNTKKFLLGSSVFVGVAVVTMLVLQLTMGAMFNYNKSTSQNSVVTIVSNENYFQNESQVMEFFDQEDLNIKLDSVKISSYEEESVTKYKVHVTSDENIAEVETTLKNKIIAAFGENTDSEENYELYITSINPKSSSVSLLNALYTTGIGLLVVGIYLSIRYRYSYAIAAIISTICTLVLTACFFGLTRIKIGSDAITSIFAITVFSLNTLIVIYDRLREMLVGKNRKYISNEERQEAVINAIKVSLPRTILTTICVTLISIILLAFSTTASYSFYLTMIIGLLISSICAIIISSQVWLLFEKRTDRKKRTFKPKKKSSKFKELEEHVFIGIND